MNKFFIPFISLFIIKSIGILISVKQTVGKSVYDSHFPFNNPNLSPIALCQCTLQNVECVLAGSLYRANQFFIMDHEEILSGKLDC
jgi:hypothetical protein